MSLVVVAVGWLRGPGATASAGLWLHEGGLLLALPCAVIAWGLTAWSLRRTRGLAMSARQFSFVLWGGATPCDYGFAVMLWSGFGDGDWGDGGGAWMVVTVIGSIVWLITLTPTFIMLIARHVLARDPATSAAPPGRPAVYGVAEREEDSEIGASGARASRLKGVGRRA